MAKATEKPTPKTKEKNTRRYGIGDIDRWSFTEPDIPQEWADHLGDLPVPFRMYVEGEGGHGKTEYVMMVSKMGATHIGKVDYNSVEQGKHKSIQQSFRRNEFKRDVKPGKWMYHRLKDFEKYKSKLKKSGAKIAIIDSISFWPLNAKQIQELFDEFPRKSFVLVGYAADSTKNRPIKHLCDIKVVIKNFEAFVRSRFEGNKPFVISKKMHLQMMLETKGQKASAPSLFD